MDGPVVTANIPLRTRLFPVVLSGIFWQGNLFAKQQFVHYLNWSFPNVVSSEESGKELLEGNKASGVDLPAPQLLQWTVDEKVVKAIEEAEKRAAADIEDVDSVLLHFNDYGGDAIKADAHASPDAFVQMALQLAYYRIYKQSCPTYESASTRQYLHGRTETIRSCSLESVAFVNAFDDPAVKV